MVASFHANEKRVLQTGYFFFVKNASFLSFQIYTTQISERRTSNPEIANRFRYGTFVHIRLQHKNIDLYDFVPPGIQNRMSNLANIFICPENEHHLRIPTPI